MRSSNVSPNPYSQFPRSKQLVFGNLKIYLQNLKDPNSRGSCAGCWKWRWWGEACRRFSKQNWLILHLVCLSSLAGLSSGGQGVGLGQPGHWTTSSSSGVIPAWGAVSAVIQWTTVPKNTPTVWVLDLVRVRQKNKNLIWAGVTTSTTGGAEAAVLHPARGQGQHGEARGGAGDGWSASTSSDPVPGQEVWQHSRQLWECQHPWPL